MFIRHHDSNIDQTERMCYLGYIGRFNILKPKYMSLISFYINLNSYFVIKIVYNVM